MHKMQIDLTMKELAYLRRVVEAALQDPAIPLKDLSPALTDRTGKNILIRALRKLQEAV